MSSIAPVSCKNLQLQSWELVFKRNTGTIQATFFQLLESPTAPRIDSNYGKGVGRGSGYSTFDLHVFYLQVGFSGRLLALRQRVLQCKISLWMLMLWEHLQWYFTLGLKEMIKSSLLNSGAWTTICMMWHRLAEWHARKLIFHGLDQIQIPVGTSFHVSSTWVWEFTRRSISMPSNHIRWKLFPLQVCLEFRKII